MSQIIPYNIRPILITAPNIVNNGYAENQFTIGIFNNSLLEPFEFKKGFPLLLLFIVSPESAGATPSRPWGLTDENSLSASQFKIENIGKGNPADWDCSFVNDVTQQIPGRSDLMGWKAVPNKDISIDPGDHLEFTVYGLKSDLPDGHTQSIFFYEKGEKGYGNYMNFETILKSPLVANGQKIGIGTADPNAQVHVVSQQSAEMILENRGGKAHSTSFLLKNDLGNWGMTLGGDKDDQTFLIGNFDQGDNNPAGFDPKVRIHGRQGDFEIGGNLYVGNDQLEGFGLSLRGQIQLFAKDPMLKDDDWLKTSDTTIGVQVNKGLVFTHGSGSMLLDNGNLSVEGNLSADGNLSVDGNLSADGNLSVEENLSVGGNLELGSDLNLTGGKITGKGNPLFKRKTLIFNHNPLTLSDSLMTLINTEISSADYVLFIYQAWYKLNTDTDWPGRSDIYNLTHPQSPWIILPVEENGFWKVGVRIPSPLTFELSIEVLAILKDMVEEE
ncbi:MAG: hypothetical protein H6563_13995 [Lewinellaceae bacterium]|nr:hypothetical protein [Lewinellaceae bacterium]